MTQKIDPATVLLVNPKRQFTYAKNFSMSQIVFERLQKICEVTKSIIFGPNIKVSKIKSLKKKAIVPHKKMDKHDLIKCRSHFFKMT